MALDVSAVPRPALGLGAFGLVPFVGLTLLSFGAGPFADAAFFALAAYGAVILSFMGGVHWGLAMAAGAPTLRLLGFSVLPSLVGWAGFLLGGTIGVLIIAAGFAGLLAHDLREVHAGRAPDWYPALRWPLTLTVIACLVLASLF